MKIKRTLVLLAFNVLFPFIVGFLTLDSLANFNSRVGGSLLAVIIPLLLYYAKPDQSYRKRYLQYGIGMTVYLILMLGRGHIATFVATFALPSVL